MNRQGCSTAESLSTGVDVTDSPPAFTAEWAGLPPPLARRFPAPVAGRGGAAIAALPMSAGEAAVRSRLRAAESEIESLTESNRLLEASNRYLEGFTASASHDLRNPLRIIDGVANLLLEDYSAELGIDASAHVHRILDATVRLERLVEALLEFSHVSGWTLKRSEVDLAAFARDIVHDLAVVEPRRRVELLTPDTLVVSGDPDLLRIAMTNLLSNAWKFTRRSDRATVVVEETFEDGRRFVTVRDNGIGFPAKDAERLFSPFERLNSAREFEGSGVGLATVQRIVERHGGSIRAEGQVGAGAAFHLCLP